MDPKTIVILSYWRLGNPGSHGKHHGLRVFFPWSQAKNPMV
jgi:hypothetical protein